MSLNESRHARGTAREQAAGEHVSDDGWVDTLRRERLRRSVRNPGLAALMSFCLMGLGQIYAGHIDRGIILMMMHLGTVVGGYSLYARGLLYETIAPHFGPAAIVAVVYVIGVIFILLWIYNIKDAYYRSLFSGLRDWFEVERILLPHLQDGGASHLLGAPVPPRARLTGPVQAKGKTVDDADEAMVIEVARNEDAHRAEPAAKTAGGSHDPAREPEPQRKKRGKRSSDRPAAAMADALEEATGVARNWRFTIGILAIFLLIGIWMFNRQKWRLEDLGPSPTLFSISSDTASGTDAAMRRVPTGWRIQLRQAVAFLETGSLTAAIGAFEDVVRHPEASPEAWKGLLRAYHRSEQMGAYEDALARYLKVFPDDADEWVTLGKLQYDRRAYVEASRSMLRCLAKDPTHLRGNYMMGAIYRELGLAEDAVPYLKKAQLGDPLNPEFNRELGAACLECRDLRNARRHLEKAASIDQADEVTQKLLEDVEAEERRTGFENAAGINAGVSAGMPPWGTPSMVSGGSQSEAHGQVIAAGAAAAAATSLSVSLQPGVGAAAQTDAGAPRGRSVVLYMAPGLKGGPGLPDLPDAVLRGSRGPLQATPYVEPPLPTGAFSSPVPVSTRTTPHADSDSSPAVIKPSIQLPASVAAVPAIVEPEADTASEAELPVPPTPVVKSPVEPSQAASENTAKEIEPEAVVRQAVASVPAPVANAEPDLERLAKKTEKKVAPKTESGKKAPALSLADQDELLANTEAIRPAETSPVQTGGAKTATGSTPVGTPPATAWAQTRARAVDAYLRGRWEEALPDLLTCLKQKEDSHLYEMVGLIFQRLGAPDDAYDATKRASQMGRKEPSFTARLGLMAAGLGKWSEGRAYLTDALAKLPHRVDLRLHLARCLRGNGDLAGARRELESVIRDPGQTYAVKRRAEQEMAHMGMKPGLSPVPAAGRKEMQPPPAASAPLKVSDTAGKGSMPQKPTVSLTASSTARPGGNQEKGGAVVLFAKPVKAVQPVVKLASDTKAGVLTLSGPGAPSRW